ncbi:hypothetical protein GUITHDRAFT_101096 [Guillardia theta CCMP2712]|uniref:Uncharacterized protein n=1 Tax=Guillardia theta (strain CCMP2712) TaxID=905079 RepID=L1JYI6_GUITC|nr:hypothetical protein GUITHDRAFT_101096 [Guillardia theta CCMP2712]EKX53394.1 hypothetical protein GUITHDRAFT_101096 [Guillardia theta CCMP2712]|eukprot:XP_005840374.1 hypothetical protein GUITHDRAFT_101096 [Guillardia theta CCMP2712]
MMEYMQEADKRETGEAEKEEEISQKIVEDLQREQRALEKMRGNLAKLLAQENENSLVLSEHESSVTTVKKRLSLIKSQSKQLQSRIKEAETSLQKSYEKFKGRVQQQDEE